MRGVGFLIGWRRSVATRALIVRVGFWDDPFYYNYIKETPQISIGIYFGPIVGHDGAGF